VSAQVSIDGQEYVEVRLGEAQQVAMATTCPPHLYDGARSMPDQVARQARRQAFV